MKKTYLLTGDIGGTNSRMFLYDPSSDKPLFTHQYRNAKTIPNDCYDCPNVFQNNVITPFLKLCWEKEAATLQPIDHVQILAVFAVAGVVGDNRVQLTNLGNMTVDGSVIASQTVNPYVKAIMKCQIINDFVAQGYGCLTLKRNEVRHLFGRPDDVENLPDGPKACIGAGTGLGECYLTPDDEGKYTCYPSEGGHVEYAPRNELEVKMFTHITRKFCSKGRMSVERVVSGKGLANVYEFLAEEFPDLIVKDVHDEFLVAEDEKGRVVATNAAEGSLCRQALQIMMSAYGCEVGSAAIKWIPKGGLFVSGGLTPKNIRFIEGMHTEFMISYLDKGRVSPILENIPLFAVMVEDLGIRGAHKAALMEFAKLEEEADQTKVSRFKRFVQEYGTAAAATTALGVACGYMLRKR